MIQWSEVPIYMHRTPVDFRKSINGLSLMVSEQLAHDPFNGNVFVFCNRARDKLKILYWERNGFWLYYRRLDKGKFHWPDGVSQQAVNLSLRELQWLLDGLSYQQAGAHEPVYGLQNN